MQKAPHSITFDVDTVELAAEPLAECYAYHGLTELCGREAIACSNYTSPVVRNVTYNPLVYAAHLAYAGHRPLVLSPDMIWLTIAQGIKHHILLHSEDLRHKFVAYSQKKVIAVEVPDGFLPESPYAEWDSLIATFGNKVLEQIHPDIRGLLIEKFSTTGAREHTAFVINMMEAFQRYFDYVGKAICGIPRITLEGVSEDWERMLEKSHNLDPLGLGWWREHLEPVLTHFIRAAKGDIDIEHWRSIYKLWKRYGNDKLTGWIITLFPYLWNKTTGEIYQNKEMGRDNDLPNEPDASDTVIEEVGEPEGLISLDGNDDYLSETEKYRRTIESIDPGIRLDEFPLGLSSAFLTIKDSTGKGERKFEVTAGFTGIRQLGDGVALKPLIGWSVHNQTKLRCLLDEIAANHSAVGFKEKTQDYTTEFPGELSELYDRFDRVVLFKRQFSSGTSIRPRQGKNHYSYVIIRGNRYIINSFGFYAKLADLLSQSHFCFLQKIGEQMQQPLMEQLLSLYALVDLPDKSHVGFTYAGRGEWHYIRFRRGKQVQRLAVIAKTAEELLTQLLKSSKPEFPDHGFYEAVQQEQGWWEMEYRQKQP